MKYQSASVNIRLGSGRFMLLLFTAFLFSVASVSAQFQQLKSTAYSSPINYNYFFPSGSWINVHYGSVISVGGKVYGTTATDENQGGTIFSVNPDGSDYTNVFRFNAGFSIGRWLFGGLVSDGTYLYGTTADDNGTVFKVQLDGNGFTTLHSFSGTDGAFPISTLVLDGTTLYGVTRKGGANGHGILYRIETDGSGFTQLFDFDGTNGGSPAGDLFYDGTNLYGCTSLGGTQSQGVIYKIQKDGTGYSNLHSFTFATGIFAGTTSVDGNNGRLVSDGTYLYGTNGLGGAFGNGNLFRIKPDGSGYSSIYDFNYPYVRPNGSLTYDGTFLYGTVETGPETSIGLRGGSLFKVKPDGSGFSTVLSFPSTTDGNVAGSNLILDGTTLYGIASWSGWNPRASFNTEASVFKVETDGSNYNKLHQFTGRADGILSRGKFTTVGSSLYGTSSQGGNRNQGNIFKINPDGSGYQALYNFAGYPDGATPTGGLYYDGGFLYGVTSKGGSQNYGTIYRIAEDGSSYSILHEFGSSDYGPDGELVPVGSSLYGMTNSGKIFRIDNDGNNFAIVLTIPIVSSPSGSLFYDGTFLYGMSQYNGPSNFGFVFRLKPDGSSFSNILSFDNTNGAYPERAALVSDGTFLYGTTAWGGANNLGTIFKMLPDGSAFSKLHDFVNATGGQPRGALTFAGSYLYGLATTGTASFGGAMFKIKQDGSDYRRVFDFWDCGSNNPSGSVIYDGTSFYGFYSSGLFKVREVIVDSFSPIAGPVGTPVTLSGSNLNPPSFPNNTSFNGTLTSQTVTATTINTVVPVGATTGPIKVTRGCISYSTAPFTVTTSSAPIIFSFTPQAAKAGASVTLNGINFSALAGNNIVYFGGARATVTSASTTQLTVTVPKGAMHKSISVQVGQLIGYSTKPFVVVSAVAGTINPCSFLPKFDLGTVSSAPGTWDGFGSLTDIDNDGKVDIIVANRKDNNVAIYRNTSTPGVIDGGSFAPKIEIAMGSGPAAGPDYVSAGDIDGDGKPDLLITNYSNGYLSVLRNISTPGSIAFETRFDITANQYIGEGRIFDIDGDGKADIVYESFFEGLVVLRNIGNTLGVIDATSFAPKVTFSLGPQPFPFEIGDLDGDGKPDVAVSNAGGTNTVSVILNQSMPGTVAFSAPVAFPVASGGVSLGDVDGDGKLDMILKTNQLVILRNTSTPGSLSFNQTTHGSGLDWYLTGVGDLNGDGRIDVAAANTASSTISVFENTSTPGSVSFASQVTLTPQAYPFDIHVSDLDGDGKNDLTTMSFGTSVFRNFIGEGTSPVITSFSPTSGPVGTTMTITGTGFDAVPANNIVQFNGTPATVSASTTTSVTVTVPSSANSGTITVQVGCYTAMSTGSFTICTPPSAPSATDASRCGTGTVTLTATGAAPGQYRWYTVATGGIPIAGETNASFTTPSITATTIYYVAIAIGSCESTRTPVNAVIDPPPAAPSVTSGTGCAPSAIITLSASGSSNGNYRWYTVATGGTAIAGQTSGSFTTPAIATTTTYYAAINISSCESARTPVVAIITPLPVAPIVITGFGCAPSSNVTVSASGGSNGQYRWYTVATGGTAIAGAVNSTLITPVLTTSTTYYVSIHNGLCEGPRTSVLAEIKSCAPQIATTNVDVASGGQSTLSLAPLVTTIVSTLDPNSFAVVVPPASGAKATITSGILTLDYSGITFAGNDKLTIRACDMMANCSQQEITVEVGGDIIIYNALSPNGDNMNETFHIEFISLLPDTKENKVSIFNRWGDLVFEVQNYDNMNRVFKGVGKSGEVLPAGTYYYKIEFASGLKTRTGFISVR